MEFDVTEGPDFNPYAAPVNENTAEALGTAAVVIRPRPCPRCGTEDAKPAPYNRWHGRRAPKAIQDVLCVSCGANFDGETGVEYPAKKSPFIWFLLALGLFFLYFGGIFFLAILGSM